MTSPAPSSLRCAVLHIPSAKSWRSGWRPRRACVRAALGTDRFIDAIFFASVLQHAIIPLAAAVALCTAPSGLYEPRTNAVEGRGANRERQHRQHWTGAAAAQPQCKERFTGSSSPQRQRIPLARTRFYSRGARDCRCSSSATNARRYASAARAARRTEGRQRTRRPRATRRRRRPIPKDERRRRHSDASCK